MALLPCKFCKQMPVASTFGDKWEIFCTSESRICAYPPCIEGYVYEPLEAQWNQQFGLVKGEEI